MTQTRAVLNEQIDKRIEELKEIAAWGAQTVDDHGEKSIHTENTSRVLYKKYGSTDACLA